MEILTFQCPKCRAILQISGAPPAPPQERIVRCPHCEFIFPAPVNFTILSPSPEGEGMRSPPPAQALEPLAQANWVNWQPSMQVESPPAPPQPSPRRPRRYFRPKRRGVPWVFLIVGLLVGLASIGLLVVLIVALWPSGKGEKSAAGSASLRWQEFVSAEGRFRVDMPGTPRSQDSVVHTRLGSLPVKAYDVESGEYQFSVFFGDLETEELRDISPEDWFDAERQIYIARANARLLVERNVSLHGYLGKERRYELSVGWMVARRMYAADRRIYTVNFSRKKQEAPEDVIARFFDSFQILEQGKSEEQ